MRNDQSQSEKGISQSQPKVIITYPLESKFSPSIGSRKWFNRRINKKIR